MAKAKTKVAKPKQKSKKKDTKAKVNTPKAKVVMVGWHNENPNVNIILLSKRERQRIGINEKSPVKVKHGKEEQIAVVGIQFREHIAEQNACSLNTKLAYSLSVKVGDKVQISPEVTESEYKAFQQHVMPSFADFLQQIR